MKIKINKQNVFMYFVLLTVIPPDIIGALSSLFYLDKIIAACSYLFAIYVLYKCIFSLDWKHNYRDKWMFFLIAVVSFRIVSSFANGSFYLTAALHQVVLGCFAIWIMHMLRQDSLKIVKTFRNLIFIYLQTNIILRIAIPKGLDLSFSGDRRIWLLGTKNGSTLHMILFIICACYCLHMSNKKHKAIRLNIIFVICLINSVVLSSSTSLLSIMCIYLVFWGSKVIGKGLKSIANGFGKLVAIVIFICMISVCFGESSGNSLMVLIAKLLGKDPTFSGRVAIWQRALTYFGINPLWGIGIGLSYDVWSNGVIVYSAHNALLSSLANYGIFVSIFWLLNIIYTGYYVFKTPKNEIGILIMAGYIGMLMSTISEANDASACLLAIILILYFIARENLPYHNLYIGQYKIAIY